MDVKHGRILTVLIIVFFGCFLTCGKQPEKKTEIDAQGIPKITATMKCHTCGMLVYEFKNWHTQIVYDDGTNDGFCAVKCLMAYYFEPERYTGKPRNDFKHLYAKDYYTLQWHDMKTMYFVLGSDVLGPMGNDLVPFIDRKKAETFLNDHNGSDVLTFDEITLDLIQKLRKKKGKEL